MTQRRSAVDWKPRDSEAGPGARWLLVVGCPRSGTRSFARMLQNAGVKVGHERVGIHGTVSSYYAVDDTSYQGTHAADRRSDHTFEHTWMLVRNPLKIIESISFGISPNWWMWQERHTGIRFEPTSQVDTAARFVLDWTNRCEAMIPERVFRIEDWKSDWPEIAERLGIAEEPIPDFSVANYRIEAQKKQPVSYEDLSGELSESVRKLATKYGYE